MFVARRGMVRHQKPAVDNRALGSPEAPRGKLMRQEPAVPDAVFDPAERPLRGSDEARRPRPHERRVRRQSIKRADPKNKGGASHLDVAGSGTALRFADGRLSTAVPTFAHPRKRRMVTLIGT